MNSRTLLCVSLLAVAGLHAPAAMGDGISHDQARKLVEEGKIRPLRDIVSIVRSRVPGDILETELEYDDAGLVYDFKILRPNGRIQEVEVHAATGQILKIEDDD